MVYPRRLVWNTTFYCIGILLFSLLPSLGASFLEQWKSHLEAPPRAGEILFLHESPKLEVEAAPAKSDPTFFWARWSEKDFIVKQLAEPSGTNAPETAPYSDLCVLHGNEYKNYFSNTLREYVKTDHHVDNNIVVSAVESSGGMFYRALTFGLLPEAGNFTWSNEVFRAAFRDNSIQGIVIMSNGLPSAVRLEDKNHPSIRGLIRYSFEEKGLFPCSFTASLIDERQPAKEQFVSRTEIIYMRPLQSSREEFAAILTKVLPANASSLKEYVYLPDGPYKKSETNLTRVHAPPVKESDAARGLRLGLLAIFIAPLGIFLVYTLLQRKRHTK